MRIDRLKVRNFKGFADREFTFDPHFNLLVGDNAAGKTSVIEALKIASGAWFLGMQAKQKAPSVKPNQVRVRAFFHVDGWTFEKQLPVLIESEGSVSGRPLSWRRELLREDGKTTTANANSITEVAREFLRCVRVGEGITLPLICSYGTERLWFEHVRQKKETPRGLPSRLDGYRHCLESEIQETELVDWIRDQSSIAGPSNGVSAALRAVLTAVKECVEDAESVHYDGRYSDLVVDWTRHEPQFLKHLSDGQAIMVTLVADIARRAAILNPHLGTSALVETPGIVLIDELDLHLHPKWQRRAIHDLKRTFPKMQFVTTSHSPQLVGEAQPSEVMILEDNESGSPPRSFGLDSSRVLEEVMGASPRNADVNAKLQKFSQLADEGEFKAAREVLEELESTLGANDPQVLEGYSLLSLLTQK